jgi:thioredoxin-like negative regulator of GroEL
MSKQVISEITSRTAFQHLLENNPGLIIIKLGAEWCGPCKKIRPIVEGFFATSPENVVCGDIDVDQSYDFYSYLKSKKMVNGIPAILLYKKGNVSFIPDDMITGADPNALHQFFMKCGRHLQDVMNANPPSQLKKQDKQNNIFSTKK